MTTTTLGDALGGLGSSHTAREIAQQPAAWREVGRTAADRRAETDAFLGPLLARPELRIVLTGAGTSAFAGAILAPTLTKELRRRIDAIPTTDVVSNPLETFAEDLPTLLVSFARSGNSPESAAATELAETCLSEVHHLIVTCNPDGELFHHHRGAQRSLVLMMPEGADDQGFAMTSSLTCMMLATLLTLRRSVPDPAIVEALATAAEQVLGGRTDEVRAVAARSYRRVVYLGSGALTGLARESTLKLLELTAGQVVSYFDSALGFRHGPKSVLDEQTLAVVYVSNDRYTRGYDLDIAAELSSALGPTNVLVVTAGASDSCPGTPWRIDGVGDVSDSELALPFAVPAQLIALQASIALGLTPDNPFPAGEVNRVVRGVTIHPHPAI